MELNYEFFLHFSQIEKIVSHYNIDQNMYAHVQEFKVINKAVCWFWPDIHRKFGPQIFSI
jgi:hypothetical protein